MRPGQAAPVFFAGRSADKRIVGGFNEAGAGCPGIPRVSGKVVFRVRVASMRPGQAAPVFAADLAAFRAAFPASMRPGQAAPVFDSAHTNPHYDRQLQ